ncbi:MAG: glycoside hydrolase family 15 protein [Leptolyngbyaceae bacterium]|nr:glycoside hydrolase family 15 protein [Leptolyngbyaceae bacterium]
MLVIQNERLLKLIKPDYSVADIDALIDCLQRQGTFDFPALANGLFPAALLTAETAYTGYANVWVRDNIHVAYAHYVVGQTDVAVKTAQTLLSYFSQHRDRFEAIIQGQADPNQVMSRPHIRFNGVTLTENEEKWPQAQNDALGYFLWLYCLLVRDDLIIPSAESVDTLALFPFYFEAIAYWQDEDSGHWEEARKVETSSIGAVVAGLKLLRQVHLKPAFVNHCCQYQGQLVTLPMLDDLIANGEAALSAILPAECIQPSPEKYRPYDGAQLFLIYPLGVVKGAIADQILANILTHLTRDVGICRYLGDSFWCADYKQKLAGELRTADFSDNMALRDQLLRPGEEAQWCIFDPIVSVIFGQKYQETGEAIYLQQQIHHLNRSLGHITGVDSEFGGFKCPELYHLENYRYAPSDATPLLWTQATLRIALAKMKQTLL